MSETQVLFAGFGGHGMLLAGKLLALAAMNDFKQVSWLPAYGAEMRGGTANVTVCIADTAVSSPYIERPMSLVSMNEQSLMRFAPKVKKGGLIIVNSTLIKKDYKRDDCEVLVLPAGDIARSVGSMKATNIVLLGAYIASSQSARKDSVLSVIESEFSSKPKFISLNLSAFISGYEYVTKNKEDNLNKSNKAANKKDRARGIPYVQTDIPSLR